MLLLVDNFDSFTHNLVHYFQVLGEEVVVKRNNNITPTQCLKLSPDTIVFSPGPGTPEAAGSTKELIFQLAGKIPLFGVCLGMQAIAEVFGGKVIPSGKPIHGKTSAIYHNSQGVFSGLKNPFTAMRYHSLIVEKSSLPPSLEITAWTEEGTIMGLAHKTLPIEGVQFHPESILTESGIELLKNFLDNKSILSQSKGATHVQP